MINPKILEIAKRIEPGFGREYGSDILIGTDTIEEFAKLIIEECIKVIDPNTCERTFANQSNEEFWKNQSIYLIVKHFGMKENK
jgi:hypothetical protein